MSKSLEQQLRNLKKDDQLTPDQFWVSKTRERMALELRAPSGVDAKATKKSWFDGIAAIQLMLPRAVMVSLRSTAMFLLVMAIAVGGWGVSVSASQKSLPGDLLYVVKLAHENQQVRRATTEKERVEVLLKHASTRVNELEQIHKAKKPVDSKKKKEQTEVVIAGLKEKLSSTNEVLEKVSESTESPDDAVGISEFVEEQTELISEQIIGSLVDDTEPQEPVEGDDQAETTDEVKEVAEDAADLVEETNVKAVIVSVEKILETGVADATGSDTEDGETEVKKKVTEKLEKIEKTLEKTLGEIKEGADEITGTVGETDVILVSTTVDIVVSSTIKTSSTSMETDVAVSSTTVQEVPVQADDVVGEVKEQVEKVGKELEEAKTLIDDAHLSEAIEKVQKLYTLQKDVKENVEEVKKEIADAQMRDQQEEKEEEPVAEDEPQKTEDAQVEEVTEEAPSQENQQSDITVGSE